MDVETTLPPEAESAEMDQQRDPVTDGLSAAVAAEQAAESGNPGDGGEAPKRMGRPPIHGRYSAAAGSDGKNPAPPAGPAAAPTPPVDAGPAPRVSIPSDLLARVVQETLTLSESGIQFAMMSAGRRAGLLPDEIDPELERAELGADRKELIAQLTPYVLQEWGVDVKVSPSVAVGLVLAPWGVGSALAYMSLARLAEEKALRTQPKPTPTPAKS